MASKKDSKSVSNLLLRPHSHRDFKGNSRPDEDFRKLRSSTFLTHDGPGHTRTSLSNVRSLTSPGRSVIFSPRDLWSRFSNVQLLYSTYRADHKVDTSLESVDLTEHKIYGDTTEVKSYFLFTNDNNLSDIYEKKIIFFFC